MAGRSSTADFQVVSNAMLAGPEEADSIEIQQNPPETIIDPINGLIVRKSLSIVKVADLSEGQTFSGFVQTIFDANQAKGYTTSELNEEADFGLHSYHFRVNHGYAANVTDGFLIYPEQEVYFLLRGNTVFRVMFPVHGGSEGMPYAQIMFATMVFDR